MSSPKIAIIGAGPAGLVCARLLQHGGVPCTIYEGEKDRHARTQGGTLDLHEDSAQLALQEAGLYEEFLANSRPDGEVLKIFTPNGKVLLDENENYGVGRPDQMKNRPEIDRVLLRGILLDSLLPDSVKWAKKLLKVEPAENQTYNLHFQDGTIEAGFDIVVGADGTWSKTRPALSDMRPHYSGVTGLDVSISNADADRPEQGKRCGGGMCLTIGKNKGILAQKNGNGSVRVYAFQRCPEHWHKECGINWADTENAKQRLMEEYYGDWDQGSKDMIIKADPEIIVRPMYMLPIGFNWHHKPGLTLIGDAAHVMTPFAGVGVNCGMQDALELARRIIKRKDEWTTEESLKVSVSDATKEYELEMWPRAKANAEKTWEYLGVFFNPIGAEEMVRYFGAIKMAEDKAKEEAKATEEAKAKEEAEATAKTGESQENGEATNPENTTAGEPQTQKSQQVETIAEDPQTQEIQLELTKEQEPQQEEPKPQEESKVDEPQAVQLEEVKPVEIETKLVVVTIQEAVPVLVS